MTEPGAEDGYLEVRREVGITAALRGCCAVSRVSGAPPHCPPQMLVVVCSLYIRPTVVQTGPFWYLSVGSITCPLCRHSSWSLLVVTPRFFFKDESRDS